MPDPKVYVFWDNSNIFIEGQKLADDKDGPGERWAFRISFENLYKLACAARPIGGGVVAGSIPPEHEEVWRRFQSATPELEFEIQERGAISGREQGVDYALQTAMLRTLTDNDQPQIAVLLTGDGQGYDKQNGFHADLERMNKKGWAIEVLAWERSCNRGLKDYATSVGVFVPLETFYESITFISGGRTAKPLNLVRRSKASPKRSQEPMPTLTEEQIRKQMIKAKRRRKWQKRTQRAAQRASRKKRKGK